MSNGVDATLKPRLCHVKKWPDFNGYGFNLHAEKGKAGQYIGKVDDNSPAAAAGLKPGDRIVEVEGTNIGNENHQQVVGRIKAAGEEVRMLVVDPETDQHYKAEKKVIKGDLEEVVYIVTPDREAKVEDPIQEEHHNEVEDTPEPETHHEPEPEPEPEPELAPVENDVHALSNDVDSSEYKIRLCHMIKRPDFQGYGFNLHAERNKPGQFIGKIDDDSPAMYADLREGDRIVEVNGENIESRSHQEVIGKIKAGGEETKLLVLDPEADAYYRSQNITVNNQMPQVVYKCSRKTGELAAESGMPVQAEPGEVEAPKPIFDIANDDDDEGLTNDEVQPETAQDQFAAETVALNEESPSTTTADEPEPDVTAAFDEAVGEPTAGETDHHFEENGEPEFEAKTVEHTESSPPEAEEIQDETTKEYEPELVPEPETVPEPEPFSEPEDTSRTVNGQASYVENTTHNEVSSKSEPAPAAVPQAQTNGDVTTLSAKEYRERLASKKKPDPRGIKMDFRSKYDMFQQM